MTIRLRSIVRRPNPSVAPIPICRVAEMARECWLGGPGWRAKTARRNTNSARSANASTPAGATGTCGNRPCAASKRSVPSCFGTRSPTTSCKATASPAHRGEAGRPTARPPDRARTTSPRNGRSTLQPLPVASQVAKIGKTVTASQGDGYESVLAADKLPALAMLDQPFLFNFDALINAAFAPGGDLRAVIDKTLLETMGVRVLWWQPIGNQIVFSKGQD